jgi:hypothetical protein
VQLTDGQSEGITAPTVRAILRDRPLWALAGVGSVLCALAFVLAVVTLVLAIQGGPDLLGILSSAVLIISGFGLAALGGEFWVRGLDPVRISTLESAFPHARIWTNTFAPVTKVQLHRLLDGGLGSAVRGKGYLVVDRSGLSLWQPVGNQLRVVLSIGKDEYISSSATWVNWFGVANRGVGVELTRNGAQTLISLLPNEQRLFPRREFASEVASHLSEVLGQAE